MGRFICANIFLLISDNFFLKKGISLLTFLNHAKEGMWVKENIKLQIDNYIDKLPFFLLLYYVNSYWLKLKQDIYTTNVHIKRFL